ncbi:Uncharacterised protein [Bordetella ansorpii]|uniref:Uncharacterized protein n=2 Tax=Bordetella ansorpii TaxID=288768 RepID=A0A157MUV2_9BORD|nr:Uncharacterised protein [Bordetella ansorpii]
MAVGGVPVSCAGNVHLSQDCIYGEQARESLRGSEVEAVWFRWSIYPMVYENRLLSLRRGAAVIVSIEETRSEIDKGFDRLMRSTIIQLIFMSLAWIAAEWLMRKNERGSDLA